MENNEINHKRIPTTLEDLKKQMEEEKMEQKKPREIQEQLTLDFDELEKEKKEKEDIAERWHMNINSLRKIDGVWYVGNLTLDQWIELGQKDKESWKN